MKHLSFVEKKIINRLIKSVMDGTRMISVWDGGEWSVKKSTKPSEVKSVIGDTDETQMRIYSSDGKYLGWVCLIHGNDWDVISDYSIAIEDLLKPTNDWVDENA